jgi:membrane protein implicated in regulation of membrane protease activity
VNWLILATIVGAGLLFLSASGSDIGVDFGLEGGGSSVTGALGAFLGIGGASGLITLGLGLPTFMIAGVATVSGFIASAIIVKIISVMIRRSAGEPEESKARSIGKIGKSITDTKPGEVGEGIIDLGDGPRRSYYMSDDEISDQEQIIITGYDQRKNMIIVNSAGAVADKTWLNMDSVLKDLNASGNDLEDHGEGTPSPSE